MSDDPRVTVPAELVDCPVPDCRSGWVPFHGGRVPCKTCTPAPPPVPVSDEAEAIPGIDPNVWEVVDTHAEWVKVPTDQAGCVAGEYLRRRAARLAGKDEQP